MTWLKTALGGTPTWSELRALGESKLVGLAIFAPVLGGLIIFSDALVSFFTPSPAFPELGGVGGLTRLRYTYLALFLIGVGSLIFRLGCPTLIRRYPTAQTYKIEEPTHLTVIGKELLIRRIFRIIEKNTSVTVDDMADSEWKPIPELNVSGIFFEEILARFRLILRVATMHMDLDSDADDFHMQLLDRKGNVNLDTFYMMVWPTSSFNRGPWLEFISSVEPIIGDILELEFDIENKERRVARLLATAAYVFGFLILFTLSLITAWLVLISK